MQEANEETAQGKIDEYLGANVSFNNYGYERCRYFGYNAWAADMIRDFGTYTGTADTLLEGLAGLLFVFHQIFMVPAGRSR